MVCLFGIAVWKFTFRICTIQREVCVSVTWTQVTGADPSHLEFFSQGSFDAEQVAWQIELHLDKPWDIKIACYLLTCRNHNRKLRWSMKTFLLQIQTALLLRWTKENIINYLFLNFLYFYSSYFFKKNYLIFDIFYLIFNIVNQFWIIKKQTMGRKFRINLCICGCRERRTAGFNSEVSS